jgi:ankyrin repeat protein
MGDSKTDVDDRRSILSGNTLLGVPEAKEKGLPGHAWELDEADEAEPTGCFFRMFFRRNRQKNTDVIAKHALKPYLASTSSKFVPKKIKAVIAARQHKKDCKLYDTVLSQCTYGTVEELTKLLTRDRKAVECIQHKPYKFLLATVTRSPEILKCLLANCMPLNLNASDENGRTVLYHAASQDQADIISILTMAGTNKEIADKDGMRALHIAAKEGRESSIAALITAGAEIEAPGPEMNKPLHYAVQHKTRFMVALRTLLAEGADINATNIKLSTPLHAAIRFNRTSAQQYLLDRGADIEAFRLRWETPIKYAVSHGNTEMLRSLLTAGANPDALTCENKTALHSAAANKDHSLVQLLLDAGCKIDPKGKNGSTPLYMAAQNGRIRNAQLLVAAGADLNAKRKGKTPLDTARKHRNLGVVEVLEKASLGLPFEVDKIIGMLNCSSHIYSTMCFCMCLSQLMRASENHADDHICSWEDWFERYIVATMDWRGIDSGSRIFALEGQ